MKAPIPIVAFLLLLASCASTKIETDIQAIRFGSGGGFTGEIKSYELTPDGHLSTIEEADTSLLKTISKEETRQILEAAAEIKGAELNKPENMSRFIEIDYKQSASDRWVWGIRYQNLPPEMKALYTRLTALTK